MATFVLDTGIIIGYLRGSPYAERVDKAYAPMAAPNLPVVSVATVAELESFAIRRGWGNERRMRLSSLLRTIPASPIAHPSLITAYAEIDAFNHGKHPSKSLPTSARTMGDNDIWIAAMASVLRANLLTTDKDFDHLDGLFFKVIYIEPC